jgi:AraC-like DNA-binding protein
VSSTWADRPDTPYLARGSFSEFDELSEATAGWDLDFRQLDGGASPAELVQLSQPEISFLRTRLDRHYDQRGSSPPGVRTFALVEEGVSGVRWCGNDVTETTLMTFHPGGEFDGVSRPGFEVFTLSFSEERLAETAATLGLPELRDLVGDAERTTYCDRPAIQDLRRGLRLLCDELARRPSTPGASWLRRELEFEIPARLLRALASSRVEAPRPSSRTRDLALKRARSFIEENPHRALSVREVCRAAGVSWRTLDYAFREHFGVTPKVYTKTIRLNAVHRELRRAEPSVLISDIANRWDFWHMGQFAADYRRLFGELPSQTIRRRMPGGR